MHSCNHNCVHAYMHTCTHTHARTHTHTHTHTQPQLSNEIFKNEFRIENLLEDFKQVGHQSSFKCSVWLNALNFFHSNSTSLMLCHLMLCQLTNSPCFQISPVQSFHHLTIFFSHHIIWCQLLAFPWLCTRINDWSSTFTTQGLHLLPHPCPEHKVRFFCLCNVIRSHSSPSSPPPSPAPLDIVCSDLFEHLWITFSGKMYW